MGEIQIARAVNYSLTDKLWFIAVKSKGVISSQITTIDPSRWDKGNEKPMDQLVAYVSISHEDTSKTLNELAIIHKDKIEEGIAKLKAGIK